MKTKLAFKTREGKAEVIGFYESLLQCWVQPNEQFTVPTRYGDAFVIACGEKSAPPLILLHGSAMNSVMWLGDAPVFAQTHRVYAVDLPGEPGKSSERQLPFRGPDFTLWMKDVLDGLGIEESSLVGISLGAWLAVKFASEYPERVEKLALLSPAGVGRQRISFIVTSALFRLLGEKMTKRLYPKVNGSQELPEVVLKYQQTIDRNFNYRRSILPVFPNLALRRLTMPVLAYAGEQDTMFHTRQTVRQFQKWLPNAQVKGLPGAGHVLIGLAEPISTFLRTKL